MQRGTRVFSFLFLTSLLIVFGFGCALPRVVVVDDHLTAEEHINLGAAYEKRGEYDHAIKEYEAAVKKLPIAYLYLGNAYLQKKDFARAEASYRKAIEHEPRHAGAYNNLAWLYYLKKEQLVEAEYLALKALELDPAGAKVYKDTLEKIRELRNLSK